MQPKQRLSMKKSKMTVKDVALRAGVSESTISRIMRNKGPVAEETRERVMEAVRATGYVPNRIAGSLASLGDPSGTRVDVVVAGEPVTGGRARVRVAAAGVRLIALEPATAEEMVAVKPVPTVTMPGVAPPLGAASVSVPPLMA